MNLMDLMMRMNSTDDVKNLIEKTERIESHTETEGEDWLRKFRN